MVWGNYSQYTNYNNLRLMGMVMDLAAFLLILLKYYGLYWLFDKEVNYEFPVRQLEMTLGVGIAQLMVYLGIAAIDKAVFDVFYVYVGLYLSAALMELTLYIYYLKVFPIRNKEQFDYHRYFGVGKSPRLLSKEVWAFNLLYPVILALVYVWL